MNYMKSIFAAVFVLSSTGVAMATLSVEHSVKKVDVLKSGYAYIHFEEAVTDAPSCSAFDKIVACDLSASYCSEIIKIALAAKLSGKKVQYSTDNTCTGSSNNINRIGRLRIY